MRLSTLSLVGLLTVVTLVGCGRFERFQPRRGVSSTAVETEGSAQAVSQDSAAKISTAIDQEGTEAKRESRWARLFPGRHGERVTRPAATVAPGVKVKEPGRFARLRFWARDEAAARSADQESGRQPLKAMVESIGEGSAAPLGLAVARLPEAASCTPVLNFLPDGGILYANRGGLLTRRGADGRIVRLGPLGVAPFRTAVSPHGRFAAVGDGVGRVWVWDLNAHGLLHRLDLPEEPVTALTFSPDERLLAVGSKKGTVSIWATEQGSRHSTLKAHDGAVNFLHVDRDGKRLWSGGWDKTLRLFDMGNGRLVRRYTFPQLWGDAMAIDPTGRFVAMENHTEVRLWDLTSGGELAILQGHSNWVRALRFGEDGNSLLSMSEDGEVILWEVPSGVRVRQWQPVSGACAVAISPDGRRLAFATREETTVHPTGGVDDMIAIARLRQEGVEIDWSLGNNDLPPYPVVELRSSPADGRVVAGDRFSLTATLYNRGKGDLFRAKGRLVSPHPALDGHTLYFGRVPPANQREWTVVVDLPRDLPLGEIPFAVEFDEAAGYVTRGIEGVLKVDALPRPEFRYSHRVVDDMSGSSVGNGDGVLQRGEAVDVIVSIRNVGPGPAHDLQVNLAPVELEGVRVRGAGRGVELLSTDEIAEFAMTLIVSPQVAVREIPVQLRIHEGGFGIDFTDRLSFPVDFDPPREVRTVSGEVRVLRPLDVFAGAGRKTSPVAQVGTGVLLEAVGELPEWVQVKLAGDRTGWVEATAVEKLYQEKLY